jgi:hypothetical protein
MKAPSAPSKPGRGYGAVAALSSCDEAKGKVYFAEHVGRAVRAAGETAGLLRHPLTETQQGETHAE